MGSVAAMSSMERVYRDHKEEIAREWLEEIPEALKPWVGAVELEVEPYHLQVLWMFCGALQGCALPGPTIDIDELADRFPCCEVGY